MPPNMPGFYFSLNFRYVILYYFDEVLEKTESVSAVATYRALPRSHTCDTDSLKSEYSPAGSSPGDILVLDLSRLPGPPQGTGARSSKFLKPYGPQIVRLLIFPNSVLPLPAGSSPGDLDPITRRVPPGGRSR